MHGKRSRLSCIDRAILLTESSESACTFKTWYLFNSIHGLSYFPSDIVTPDGTHCLSFIVHMLAHFVPSSIPVQNHLPNEAMYAHCMYY